MANEPFTIMVADWFRLLCVLMGGIVVGQIVAAVVWGRLTGMSKYQQSRFVALTLGAIVAVFTEIGRLGHQLTWRLPFNFMMLAAAIYGMVGMTYARRRHDRRLDA